MTKDEAMKLALEALEQLRTPLRVNTSLDAYDVGRAITALREALAEQPAQQKPVAWMHPDGRIWTFGRGLDKSTFTVPLYTSPPAQRQARSADTWVVPDFLTAHDPETPEYRNGWNDCRQLMMEMYKREIK